MLELDAVTKSFGAFELGPIDLTVDDDVLAILGPSGSGKTTLLSLVGGILSPDTGRIRIDGTDLTTRPIEARGAVMMFQSGALFPHMTARENIEYAATSSTLVRRIIDLFDIRNILDQYPQSLSGGEEQRVSLARSLTADPDVLLLDEPLSSLDVPIRRRLRAEIRDVFESLSIPVMYVTHDRHEATVVGDELAVITDGQIHQRGPPQDVLRRPDTRFVARFTGSHNIFRVHVAEDGPSPSLRWDGRRLIASSADLEVGKTVSVAVRPECVELGGEGVQGTNVFNGTVADYVLEGDVYRVEVHVDSGTDTSLVECLTFPLAFERAEVERGDTVTVRIPPDAVSVLYDR